MGAYLFVIQTTNKILKALKTRCVVRQTHNTYNEKYHYERRLVSRNNFNLIPTHGHDCVQFALHTNNYIRVNCYKYCSLFTYAVRYAQHSRTDVVTTYASLLASLANSRFLLHLYAKIYAVVPLEILKRNHYSETLMLATSPVVVENLLFC